MKISIITPSFNRANFIGQALESVRVQDYFPVEHIIIDGGSTDGSLDILSSYPDLRVVSEPDNGMYDALNKGLAIAQGEVIGFLNSDDIYEPGIFASVVETFMSHPKIDAVIGRTAYFENDNSRFVLYPAINAQTLTDQLFSGVSAINGWFFRYEVFKRAGNFDQAFPISADRDFLIRLYVDGLKPVFVDKVYYYYRMHGGSLTINLGSEAQERIFVENRRLAQKYIQVFNHDADLRHRCIVWHDLTSIELTILLMRKKRYLDAVNIISTATRQNWLWPLIVLVQAPGRILSYLKKNYGSHC